MVPGSSLQNEGKFIVKGLIHGTVTFLSVFSSLAQFEVVLLQHGVCPLDTRMEKLYKSQLSELYQN